MYKYLVDTESLLPFLRNILDNEVDNDLLEGYYLGPDVLERGKHKRRSARISVSPSGSYMTLTSMYHTLHATARKRKPVRSYLCLGLKTNKAVP